MADLFSELKRRNVFRVGAAYVVLSWLVLQIGDVVFEFLTVPAWAGRLLIALLAIGFIPALFFSWVYELTPEGIKKESDIASGRSAAGATGRKLDYATIAMVVLGIAFALFQQRYLQDRRSPIADAGPASLPAETQTPAAVVSEASGPSIAVLPFVNMSADPENEYFADGLSEELLNQLAQIPRLMVAGRTSSFSFKGKKEDLRSIGASLGVANVLEGSVRRQGNQVRITAQLIRVGDGFHLWSASYDRTLDNVFAIQDDIAASVARALRIVLDEKAWQAMQAVSVRNVEAFVAYQKGKDLFEKAHGSAPLLPTLAEGNRFFTKAIELVPDFGAAWWIMADYHAHLIVDPETQAEDRAQALVDLRRVLDAAFEYSNSPVRRAFIDVDRVLFSGDWTPLTGRIEAALATEGCPDPTWIEMSQILGYARAMAPMWDRYIRCEPLSTIGWIDRSVVDILSGDLSSGLVRILKAREKFGAHPWISAWQHKALLAMGRFEEADALAPEFASDRFYGWGAEVLPLAAQGHIGEARAALARWEDENGPIAGLSPLAAFGDRTAANARAAALDAQPAGPFQLLLETHRCTCGSPFDPDAAPNLKARLAQAGIQWDPPEVLDFPAKNW